MNMTQETNMSDFAHQHQKTARLINSVNALLSKAAGPKAVPKKVLSKLTNARADLAHMIDSFVSKGQFTMMAGQGGHLFSPEAMNLRILGELYRTVAAHLGASTEHIDEARATVGEYCDAIEAKVDAEMEARKASAEAAAAEAEADDLSGTDDDEAPQLEEMFNEDSPRVQDVTDLCDEEPVVLDIADPVDSSETTVDNSTPPVNEVEGA